MARVKPSLLSEISGCIESTEFAMTRNGIVAKRRKPCRRLDRPRQIDARTVFSRRVADWHTMTTAAKTEWNAYAATHPVVNRLGHSKYITGYNWFLKLRDTEDGILLPFGTAPMPLLGTISFIYGGPYTIPITWPAESTDEWAISFDFGFMSFPNYCPGHINYRNTGWIMKPAAPADWYNLLTSLSFWFLEGATYMIAAAFRGPRLFPSYKVHRPFTVEPAPQYAFHLAMDDDAATPTVIDAYGHYNQTFEGTDPNTEDHSVPGVHGTALSFDGSTSKIELTTASYQSYLDNDQDFTIALWWKPDIPQPVTLRGILSSLDFLDPYIYFCIRDNQSTVRLRFLHNGSLYVANVDMAEEDTSVWRHFAVVRNGTNIKIFRNGITRFSESDAGYAGRPWASGKPLYIGCTLGSSYFAAGAADDVYLFNRALSDAEVLALATP